MPNSVPYLTGLANKIRGPGDKDTFQAFLSEVGLGIMYLGRTINENATALAAHAAEGDLRKLKDHGDELLDLAALYARVQGVVTGDSL